MSKPTEGLKVHSRRATELRAMLLFQVERLKARIIENYSFAIHNQLAEVTSALEDLEAHMNGAP